MREISVLLADGHEAYREGLARAIHAHPRLELVGEASDGRHALESVLVLEPDVAVLELRMPALDGLEVCQILRGLDRTVATRLVLISGETNDTVAVAARSLGVVALLSKDSARHELCERLVQIAGGPVQAPGP